MPYNATIVALGAVGVGSGSMKLALYADDGTGTKPSTAAPVAATATSIALGISAVETTNFLPQPTSLTQGATYWLAFKLNIVANIRAQANASQVGLRVTSQPFGDAFPANPAGGSPLTVNGNEFAVYMRVHDTN